MHRFYLPPEECRGSALTLTGREAHHALRVLRVRRDERVTVMDGAGTEFLCDVCSADRNTVGLRLVEKKSIPPLPCQVVLLQAIPKGKLIEAIIEKATELGAHRIVPILSERVTTRLDDSSAAEKADKWRLAAIEAIKQCGSAWLPRVDAPMTPKQFLARQEGFDLALVGSLQSDARHPRECLREFKSRHRALPRTVCVWIGPEGDFTPDELRAVQSAGAQPISLGRLVLRVETAAVYCLSFLNYELESVA
ncbi:MAG: 16S rRNA (uracil(1498)-N(3))-methyltransferase [Verrucomicrobia bacterium]|jgi:16S rRNA (uracil1498-N3)-methyltransferase|nr:16S rRNA (uracil(1498)-N(3))-methyltransferase [Verrucomicrobiota bacterium]